MATRFLSNDSLWSELQSRVKVAKSVKAAVAFLGKSGADLLPLKKGDTLVVNLGIQAVKQGLTSPHEIKRFMDRGVTVFSRSSLHAKFFLMDRTLMVGSANVSNHSRKSLDEAAALTDDPAAILRATDFFEKLCTEPVGPEYLKRCLQVYKPPVFNSHAPSATAGRKHRVIEAKLWLIGGLVAKGVPKKEQGDAERVTQEASKRLREPYNTFVNYCHYSTRPGYMKHLREGDWVIKCTRETTGDLFVYAPERVLRENDYDRGGGKRRYILSSEAHLGGEAMSLAVFRKRVKAIVPRLDTERPRTMPVEDVKSADDILRLWTANGRIAKHKKSATTRRRTAK